MRVRILALIAWCAAPFVAVTAHAESLYVIEQLVVSVNSAPDGTGERVAQIKSGEQVELIERQDDQAHIRLTSGQEGWVRGTYLSAEPPLREQLTARNEEIGKLRKEKAQLETDLAAAKSAVATASAAAKAAAKQAASAPAANPTPAPMATSSPPPEPAASEPAGTANSAAADGAGQSAPPLFEDRPMMPSRPSWLLAFAAVVVALGVGFAVGWRVLDRRIRAKYGGLRIY
jgi:SH3 domain-containing protein